MPQRTTNIDSYRITNLEDRYMRCMWYVTVHAGTTGTITPPTGGTLVMDQWPGGVDAKASTITAGEVPTGTAPQTSGGVDITVTLSSTGAWALSGTPSAYPIAIIYCYKIKLHLYNQAYNIDTGIGWGLHSRQHAITSTSDHTATAGDSGYMLKANASGLPVKATNTDTDVADAVTKKHTQNTDTGTTSTTFQVNSGAATKAIITGGSNTFNIADGTASLDVAAGAAADINANLTVSGVTNIVGALDVASGKTVNIDDDVTVSAELHVEAATHVNQDLTTDATPKWDAIAETTAEHGVAIDGWHIKDGSTDGTFTGGTNTFNITKGTASLDVATGKTVNIDDDVTVAAELHVEAATHVNQDLTSDSSPTHVTVKLSGLADGKIPYHVDDSTGLADGPTKTDVDDAVTKKHTAGTDTALAAVGTKNPPIDADKALYRDSTASDALVTSTWTQVKAFLKTYFDTVYAAVLGEDDNYVTDAEKAALHAGVTLDANADTLLSLSTQALGLDTKAANIVFSGPTSGAAAVPTFRSLVAADLPAASTTAQGASELATVAEAVAGTSTSLVPTCDGLAAHVAVIANPKATAQGVNLTAAAAAAILTSHSTVFSNTTNSFAIGGIFALPLWTPAANQVLRNKWATNVGYKLEVVATTGAFILYLNDTTYTSAVPGGGAASNLVAGTAHSILAVPTVGTTTTTVSFYLDGVLLSATAAQNNEDVTNTSDMYTGGTSAARYAMTVYDVYDYNRALSAAEVLSLYRNGIAWADKWGSQTAVYTSDFSAGEDSWTASNGAVAGNIDSIGGENDWLRFTINDANLTHRITRTTPTLTVGKKYRMTLKYFIPTANSIMTSFSIWDGAGGTKYVSNTLLNTINAATTYTFEFTATNTAALRLYGLGGGAFQDAGGDDILYIKTVEIKEIGATLALESEGQQGDKWYDSSSNDLHASYPASGYSLIRKNWYAPVFNVCSYGAAPTASAADNTTAFRAALADAIAVNGTMYVPHGHYDINDQLNVTSRVNIQGEETSFEPTLKTGGSVIHQTADKPLFYLTSQCTIEDLSLYGSDNVAHTSNDLIYAYSADTGTLGHIHLRNLLLNEGYNLIHFTNVFYSYLDNITFYDYLHTAMLTDGAYSEGTGNAFQINNCQVTANNAGDTFDFSNIGSIIINSLMLNNVSASSGHGIVFNTFATNAGMSQICNSAIEPHGADKYGLYFKGTSGDPADHIFIDNCYIAGEPSVYIDYGNDLYFNNCYYTGDGDHVAFHVEHTCQALVVTNGEYEVSNSACFTATNGAVCKQFDIMNPHYAGSGKFIDFSNLTLANCTNILAVGGERGTNATPIDLPAGAISTNIGYDGPQFGTWTPALIFTTMGDLEVTYTVQRGTYTKIGKMVTLTFEIDVDAFTYTTATGTLEISGLPFTSAATYSFVGTLSWEGITKANYTQIVPMITPGVAVIRFDCSGSGQAISSVVSANAASGSNVVLNGTITYRIA